MNTISEADFLLTELRYTLGQIHVQVLDLDPDARRAKHGDESVDSILAEMLSSERGYQRIYAGLLETEIPRRESLESPLPVGLPEEAPDIERDFERARGATIELLSRLQAMWPEELPDIVKRQIAEDRRSTTALAECRKDYFSGRAARSESPNTGG